MGPGEKIKNIKQVCNSVTSFLEILNMSLLSLLFDYGFDVVAGFIS